MKLKTHKARIGAVMWFTSGIVVGSEPGSGWVHSVVAIAALIAAWVGMNLILDNISDAHNQ